MFRLANVLLMLVLSVNIAMATLPGSGTEVDPYRIESKADFNDFSAAPNYWDEYIRLDTDINLSGEIFDTAPIAYDPCSSNETFEGITFSGVFDGNDNSISNLTIDTQDAGNDFLGLFGKIDSSAQVRNLGVENCDITGGDSSKFVGGLIGYAAGSIEYCYSTGSIQTGDYAYYLGGLVGQSESGDIIESYSSCNISNSICDGLNWLGGLAGFKNKGGDVSGCYSTGSINAGYSGYRVGGLIGKTYSSSSDPNIYITNCNSSSSITLYDGWKVGGLVGYSYQRTLITNSFSKGDVHFKGATTEEIGGLIGKNRGDIIRCWSSSSLIGGDPAAAAVYPEKIGGLTGSSDLGTITMCYSSGSIGAPQEDMFNYVYTCYASEAGGLVGRVDGGIIEKSFSASSVWGNSFVGGLIGNGGVADVNECYAMGSVIEIGSSPSDIGGLVGDFDFQYGDVTNCFWDTDTSGQFVSDAGTGKPTKQLRMKSTFTSASWDFENTWDIRENLTYPYLLYYNRADLNTDEIVNFKDLAILAENWLKGVN